MKRQRAGFTIVETLIVLAVSGVLFISVAALISGQINRYRTRDAVFNLESSVRDVLNDVSTGYYPEKVGSNPDCSGGTAGSGRGTNTGCVIAGKSITFGQDNIIINTVIANSDGSAKRIAAGTTETKNYEWGIKPTSAPPGKTYFVLNNTYGTAYSPNISGGQSVGLFVGTINNDPQKTVSISPVTNTNNLVCFVNGGQNSSITLGKDGGITVAAQIKESSPPC